VYVPRSEAPGYAEDEGWDTGSFATERRDAGADVGGENKAVAWKKIPRVKVFIGRKPEC